MPSYSDSPEFIKFIDWLLSQQGMKPEGMDAKVLGMMRQQLAERLERRIDDTIVRSLSQEQLDHFEQLLNNDKDDEIMPYLDKIGVDVGEIVRRCMEDFKNTYLGINQR